MTAEPSKRKEIIKDKQFLSSQKLGANEADIEKIKIQFMAIVRDIKSGMQKKEPTKAVATAEAVQMIRNALPDKPASDISVTIVYLRKIQRIADVSMDIPFFKCGIV